MRYQYGAKRRSDGQIVQKSLKAVKESFKTLNLTFVYGEIYRRPVVDGVPGEWERDPR